MSKLDVAEWKEFKIGGDDGLFSIVKGRRLRKVDMIEGRIPFIGAAAYDNGITNMIANDAHLHPSNTITVTYNGNPGVAFYQGTPFWASDDVNVLYPRFELNEMIALFICPIIRVIGRRYAFVDKWKLEDMANDSILLPVTEDGVPDWEYMEQYMAAELEKADETIDAIAPHIDFDE